VTRQPVAEAADATVLRLLREVLPWQYAEKDVRPELSLQSDLGIESLGKVALAFRLEEELGVDISLFTGDIADIQTVADLLAAAHQLVAASHER
jgi:acyl carrier protein